MPYSPTPAHLWKNFSKIQKFFQKIQKYFFSSKFLRHLLDHHQATSEPQPQIFSKIQNCLYSQKTLWSLKKYLYHVHPLQNLKITLQVFRASESASEASSRHFQDFGFFTFSFLAFNTIIVVVLTILLGWGLGLGQLSSSLFFYMNRIRSKSFRIF